MHTNIEHPLFLNIVNYITARQPRSPFPSHLTTGYKEILTTWNHLAEKSDKRENESWSAVDFIHAILNDIYPSIYLSYYEAEQRNYLCKILNIQFLHLNSIHPTTILKAL